MKKYWILLCLVFVVALTVYLPHWMVSPGHLGLSHKTLENKCLSCHKPFFGIASDKCTGCHQLDKIGVDTVNSKILFHKKLQTQNCTSCHTDHKGTDGKLTISNFNHALISASIVSNCSSCHQLPGNALHQQVISTSCSNCHTTNSWKNATFKHSSLPGTVSQNCISCHASPKDNFHNQQSATSCSSCHTTNEWKPSTFNHEKYFAFDKHHTNTCTNCHTNNNYVQYSCTNCHEHSMSKLISKHSEEGIIKIDDCAKCHKSGNEHDIQFNNNNNNGDNAEKVKQYVEKNKNDDD
ncbi:MAG: hypothetical protein IPP48_10660 [Chitinophagaceae bacterium]|nr:hypothetical protein [Chitinophagaceae bacterium]